MELTTEQFSNTSTSEIHLLKTIPRSISIFQPYCIQVTTTDDVLQKKYVWKRSWQMMKQSGLKVQVD